MVVAFLLSTIPDFETISSETVGAQFKEKDVFFCTLGTTRRTAGSAVSHYCLMLIGDSHVTVQAYNNI